MFEKMSNGPLWLGMGRGCMDLGRQYQGKYVPPDRNTDEKKEVEEDIVDETQEVIEECVSKDIDLD